MKSQYTGAELMAAAKAATDKAAEYLRTIDRSGIEREYKTDPHDIVTKHDKQTEEIIKEVLLKELPGCTIVGEESGESVGDSSVICYVDPIDGTSFFASGSPNFCTTVGIEQNGKLIAGVVNAPIMGWEFKTDGDQVWFNDTPVSPPAERPTQDCLALTYFPLVRDYNIDKEATTEASLAMKKTLASNVAMAPAALQMCYVAMGWADLTYYSYISSWDIAGGMAIVHALGGRTDSYPKGHIKDGRHHLSHCLVTYGTNRKIEVVDRELQGVALRRYPELA
ncbi:hypothetical protein BSR29_08240 [Boudabousia liubingyangii]|uniref:inositol-phosphate phosphatase n=1 Tax=Boudabousia liubingyangii TaxID=1921764 RepID=A0A1Q5PJ94_9ACTO|nr:inositol monophosphatase family protein [Boudabousia liubingyangii]OKL45961.1 hypothetical protein BSR29_08240 [Boudabousia liubingyangii]